MDLKALLTQLRYSSTGNEIAAAFNDLKQELFSNYHLEKNGQEYYFLEIEFYFCNKQHADIITYPRNINGGRWFFHQSGIDLTFQSSYHQSKTDEKAINANEDYAFGGILIRKLLKRDTQEEIDGPCKCEWELFDNFDAFEAKADEMPKIVRNRKPLICSPIAGKRKFSYSEEQLKKKYQELIEKTFIGSCPITFEGFRRFIKEGMYAFKIDKSTITNQL